MAQYNKLGYAIDQIIAEDWALPNNTLSAFMTNIATIDSKKQGNLRLLVCASLNGDAGPTELAGGASLTFIPYLGATTTPDVALPGTVITQGVQTDASWVAGEVICEIIIPRTLIPSTAKYLGVKALTTADESGDKVEVYLLAD